MKSILFNQEMVKAILEGRKTQTRRIIKPQPKHQYPVGFITSSTDSKREGCYGWSSQKDGLGGILDIAKPPYHIGDILWVRETWLRGDDGYHYRADETIFSKELRVTYGYKWKPSIHMPRVAARIFLKVTDVRVEMLKDMKEDEALKEGFISTAKLNDDRNDYTGLYALEHFRGTWDKIYPKQGWKDSPWVWVIEFEKI